MSITPNVIRVIAEGEWAPATGLVCGVPDDASVMGCISALTRRVPAAVMCSRISPRVTSRPARQLCSRRWFAEQKTHRAKTRKPRLRKQTQYIKQKRIINNIKNNLLQREACNAL